MRTFLAKLRDDRGNLTLVIGVTLLAVVIGTLLTMNTAAAAALMKSSETSTSIRAAIADVKAQAYYRLTTGQQSAVGVTTTTSGIRSYVVSQTKDPATSSTTLTIVGQSLEDNSTTFTVEQTYTQFQANFFGGYDAQGNQFWLSVPGSYTNYAGLERGYR